MSVPFTTAIVQCADTGPLESLALMFRAVGVRTVLPNRQLKSILRSVGCDTVLDVEDLVRSWGYETPSLGGARVAEAGPADMARSDVLYVDVKGHRAYDRVVKKWPNLERRVLWYRINGGKPEHVVNQFGDCGDEVDPPCPVLTPNQWYADEWYVPHLHEPLHLQTMTDPGEAVIDCDDPRRPAPWADRSYCMWPPFYRFDEYDPGRRARKAFVNPVCLIHNVNGWGYRDLVGPVRELGVRVYGHGSPDGVLPHEQVRTMLGMCLAYVHLKSNDAPGYALYEALAAGCPVVVPRRLIWRCRMGDLLEDGKTCLTFDRETHDALTPTDVASCRFMIENHLKVLADPDINRLIGDNGRRRLAEVMWSEKNPKDVESLREFLTRHFSLGE